MIDAEIHTRLGEGWDGVSVRHEGDLWRIAGTFAGVFHSGARTDPLSLADDLSRIARTAAAEALGLGPAVYVGLYSEPLEPFAEPEPDEPDGDDTFADVPGHTGPRGHTLEGFNPAEWSTLSQAQAALRWRVGIEHSARTQTRALSLDRALDLALMEQRSRSEEIELTQHTEWRDLMKHVDAVKDSKLSAIAALDTLEEARAYVTTVEEGWTP